METRTIYFPQCVRTSGGRVAVVELVKSEDAPLRLIVEQNEDTSDTDISQLINVLAQQRNVAKIVFRSMVFPCTQAQTMVAFMSRYAPLKITFEMCHFIEYAHCDMLPIHPCTRMTMDRCKMRLLDCCDFAKTVLPAHCNFNILVASRCLDGSSLISGVSA